MTKILTPRDVRTAHRDKLFGGLTAEQVHIQALGKPCYACQRPALVTFETFVPLEQMTPEDAMHASMMSDKPGQVPIHRTRHGEQWVPVKRAYACKACAPEAERVAARLGGRYHIMIDRGPGPDATTLRAGG